MKTVLIAEPDANQADLLKEPLLKAGYRVLVCPGPWPPARCIRCDVGYCPIAEAADVVIYNPGMVINNQIGETIILAIATASAHPDVPLILAWSGDQPANVALILKRLPGTKIARAGNVVNVVDRLLSNRRSKLLA